MKHNKFGKQKSVEKWHQSPFNKKKESEVMQAKNHKSEDLGPKKKVAKLMPEIEDSDSSEGEGSYELDSDDSVEEFDDYGSFDDSDADDSENKTDKEEEKPILNSDKKKVTFVDDSDKAHELKTPPKEVQKLVVIPVKEVKPDKLVEAITKILLDNAASLAKEIIKEVQAVDIVKSEVDKGVKVPLDKFEQKVGVPIEKAAGSPMPDKCRPMFTPGFSSSSEKNKKKNRNKKRKAAG